MKKMIAGLFLTLAVALSLTPAMAQISGQVTGSGLTQQVSLVAAPQNRADGTASGAISDREGNQKVALGHAEYTESTRRGKLFTLAANAYTIIAANVSAGSVGSWKPVVGFYNPIGSGVNAVLVNAKEYHTSGTPGGPLLWNFFCGQNWSSTVSGSIFNDLLSNNTPNGSAMIAQNNTAVGTTPAISSTLNVLGVLSGPPALAVTAGTGEAGADHDLKGQIVVPPGCLIGLAATATGTTDIVSASISWEEVSQ